MNPLPTLFKRTASGATQEWIIKAVRDQDDYAAIVTTYGQAGGAMQSATVHVRKGKNLGKANVTTPIQQAEAEAAAKWKKQKDKGYVESLDRQDLDDAVAKRPMLAQDYKKHKHKVDFSKDVYVQPKLDGIRCLAHKEGGGVRLVSRGNKPIDTLPHVNAELASVMRDGEVWDGELYIHGDTFQDLTSWVKRAQPDSNRVEYHVYDAIEDDEFGLRQCGVNQRIDEKLMDGVVAVLTLAVTSDEQVRARHDEFVGRGYEGAMVRHNGCPYREGARSSDLLKMKEFLEEEFVIVGVGQGKGKFEGLAVFTLKTDRGVQFECAPRGNENQRKAYYQERDGLVGKFLTVRFFEWTTSTHPAPRFPVGIAVREYKSGITP